MILTINTGSSSIRLGLHQNTSQGLTLVDERHVKPDEDVPENLVKKFLHEHPGRVDAVSHRIVHGGSTLTEACIIDQTIEQKIAALSLLAPLHNPAALKWIKACRKVVGTDISQIAVFDTAFYSDMPEVSKIYALPKDLCSEHAIKRYGFHGIAHRAMLKRLEQLRPDIANKGKVISIQLGSGCSITAINAGKAVDTSMGFSPNEGLLMSTRSGDVDSGVLVYLQKETGMPVDEIDTILNRSSGLYGVSGISGDMKTLLVSDSHQAKLAIELYCYRIKKYIGAYTAILGGLDCILFGGGVGENAPIIRQKILDEMDWCGIALDSHTNEITIGKEGYISPEKSKVDVMVIPVDEAEVLAEEAVNVAERL
jgi:acetate kinase